MPHGNGFGPPEVFSGSQKMKDIDVSLSHDGRFVAAAVAKSG
jgi:phosphopantetheinyl transferase (holo-ACP synthase)